MGSLMIYFYTNLKFTIGSIIERGHDNIIVISNSMVTNAATTTFAVAIKINELELSRTYWLLGVVEINLKMYCSKSS